MEFKAYKLTYYLNARHSMDHFKENSHSHTFCIRLCLEDLSKKGFINFDEINDMVNGFIGPFSRQYLNETKPFGELLPTLEHIGAFFYEQLKVILMERSYELIQLEISENPLRVYSISDRLYMGSRPIEQATKL